MTKSGKEYRYYLHNFTEIVVIQMGAAIFFLFWIPKVQDSDVQFVIEKLIFFMNGV